MMSTFRKTPSGGFKREAIQRAATTGKSIKQLERELLFGEGALRLWLRKARDDGGDAFPVLGGRSRSATFDK